MEKPEVKAGPRRSPNARRESELMRIVSRVRASRRVLDEINGHVIPHLTSHLTPHSRHRCAASWTRSRLT